MANENTPVYRLGGPAAMSPRGGGPAGKKGRATWRAWVMALAWYIVTVLVLAVPAAIFHPYQTQLGAPARADVKAPYEFSVDDRDATENDLADIPQRLDHVWVFDDEMNSRAQQRLQKFFDMLREENPAANDKLRDFVRKVDDQLGLVLDMTTVNQFQENHLRGLRPPLSLKYVQGSLSEMLAILLDRDPSGNYKNVIVSDKVEYSAQLGQGRLAIVDKRGHRLEIPKPEFVLGWPKEVRDDLAAVELPRYFQNADYAELRQAGLEFLMALLRQLGPNLTYDSDGFKSRLNQRIREREASPIQKIYNTDELIVKKGEPLSRLQAGALERINEMTRNNMAIKVGGIMLLTLILFTAVGFYLLRFRRDVVLDASTVTLHVLPPLMAVAIGQIMAGMGLSENAIVLWFPAAMVGLLSSILMTPQVAFVLTLSASCLFGVVTGQDLSFLIFALFGGFAAVFASRRVRARGEVLWVGVQVGLVNAITLVILQMLDVTKLPDLKIVVAALLSGIACAFGTLVLLVLFERMFGIITDLRLLELTGLRNPLIAQFEEKAPGSYQHVLNVVKLAEAAAQAIGANYLLVRAGAYFHDVGKMIKPKYFSENQVTLDDKKAHSRLSPYMSVLIIKNHVKEGIELARRYHLPQKVVDFIPQHHGASLIRYFYSEAMKRYAESGAIDEPREEDFRYPGPKPQSIEAAIVMLSDSVEAVAASKFTGGQVSEGELRKLVQTAITDKFDDGQFDECDLTMRHLYLIRESFVKTLLGRYHFRVAYPTMPVKREAAPREAREPAIAIAGPG